MTVVFGRVKKLENISKRLSTTSHEDDFVKCLCSSYQVNFIFIFCSFGFLGRFLNRYLSSASDWPISKWCRFDWRTVSSSKLKFENPL